MAEYMLTGSQRPAARIERPAWMKRDVLTGVLLFAALVFLPGIWGNPYWTFTFLLVTLYASVAILQNVLLEEAGQFSLGQGAVFGAAAITVGVATGMHGLPYLAGGALGVVVGLLVGILYAAPALRVQGYYLAFVTLSAALVFPQLVVAFDEYTGGINGTPVAVPALSEPIVLGLSPLAICIFVFACAVLAFHAKLPKTGFGRRLIVAAKSPEAAQSLGIRPGRMRAAAFLVTALGTSIAGVLYVPLVGFVAPSAFKLDLSTLFFFAVVVGGQGKLLGPIVGTLVLYLLPNVLFAELAQYRLLMYGIAALLVTFLFPDGILGSLERWIGRMRSTEPAANIDFHYIIDRLAALPAAAAATGIALNVHHATKRYNKVLALNDLSMTVRKGSIHGLVGPNGSGKTTLLNVISGFVRADEGSVWLREEPVGAQPAWRRARSGLGRTFQTPRIFESLSLWDNVRVAHDVLSKRHRGIDVFEVLDERKSAWASAMPALLSHGQRRLLEVVRVMATDSEVILLDEAASGLSPHEREALVELLKLLRDRLGRTIVLVEHDLNLVWNVADRITVLDNGTVVAEGAPEELRRDPRVQTLFGGASDHA